MRSRGFTLIELMIVVVVVAVLALIALPLFTEQIHKSRRSEAFQGLSDMQLRQERWRANHTTYANTTSLGLPTSTYYTFAVTAASNTATGYIITATPASGSSQAGDRCGIYTFTMASGTVSKSAGGNNCSLN